MLLVTLLMGVFCVSCGLGQESEPAPSVETAAPVEPAPPVEAAVSYPGAVALIEDQEFQRFQARETAIAAGMPADAAQQVASQVTLSAFTTSASVDSVVAHLAVGAVETLRETVAHPDSMVPAFLGSLTDDTLEKLARAVDTDLSGLAYRDAFLAGLSAEEAASVDYAFVAHENEDGTVTYYEIQRPYFDVGDLRWKDETRIRVMHFPFNPL
jgi:hypothetical protein